MLSAMLMDAYSNECPGIGIVHKIDGQLLNSRRMQTATRLSTTAFHDLFFEDDCSLNIGTEADLQRSVDFLASGCANFSTAHRHGQNDDHGSTTTQRCIYALHMHVNDTHLKTVDRFTYLDSTLSRHTKIDDGMDHRICRSC
ncbi:hypothetical protein SprV_0401616600 [Sparganum proliferum]